MCTISVQFDALGGIAGELAALAAELDDDAELCRSAAAALSAALGGDEGWTSGGAAVGWGSLTAVVAARAAAVAATIAAAADAYRVADAGLSGRLAGSRPATVPA